ncbi:MAG: antitoxin [Gemmatimonadetes bacterium]|nr:antitoxin [Gemmatimonadota bacterium]
MRTTVTLDADVEQRLREAMRRQGKGFKETLNDALRRGLGPAGPESAARQFVVESRPLRLRTGLDPARLRELDDDLEIAEFLRKTALLQERRG